MSKRLFRMNLMALGIASSLLVASLALAQERPYNYKSGKDIYEHVCQGCHMPNAQGAIGAGAYPALAKNPRLQAGVYPVMLILRGMKTMPSFPELDDEQIAAVTNYIRTNYGNNYSEPVTAKQVKELRASAIQRKPGRAG
jgi:mono/diheme cytochrome c family protein